MRIYIFAICLSTILFGISCSDSEDKNNEGQTDTTIITTIKNENPKDLELMQKLDGKWRYRHEPISYVFKGAKYMLYSEDQLIEEGIWSITDQKLIFTKADNTEEIHPITFVGDVFCMEDIPVKFYPEDPEGDPGIKSEESFVAEFGYEKAE